MQLINAIWNYLVLSAPYLLFGFLISGVINHFVSVDKIKKYLGGNNLKSVINAALIGVPLPLCSCSVIPTAVTLKKNGASNAATSSFLIATPESGIDSISITYGLMDLTMTIVRPLAAFITAFVAGIGQLLFNKVETKIEAEPEATPCCCSHKKSEEVRPNFIKGVFSFSFGKLTDDIALWLFFGLIVGGLIDYFVPANLLQGMNGHVGRLFILAIGIPFYICASSSTPIAASLVMKGLSPGSALIFLLVGPATNISNIIVMSKYLGKKGIAIHVAAIAIVSLILSYLVDWFYSALSLPVLFKVADHQHQHSEINWFAQSCAVILMVLLLKGIYREVSAKFFSK